MNLLPDTNKHVIVTSPMRTGSTWLVNMLRSLLPTAHYEYVTSLQQANDLITANPLCVLKSHGLIDLDWEAIDPAAICVRILRNYKDSLISRALYTRCIRPSEGLEIHEPEMRDFLGEIGDVSDEEFVCHFIDRCSLINPWLAEIAVMERGDSERCITITYEGLMHNPYDAMAELVMALWPGWSEAVTLVPPVVANSIGQGLVERRSFYRFNAVGVGGWERYVSPEQSRRLDALYFELRSVAHSNPALRNPTTSSPSSNPSAAAALVS